MILAYYRVGKRIKPVTIRSVEEFGLLMAFLELKSEQAGVPIAPMKGMREYGKTEQLPVTA